MKTLSMQWKIVVCDVSVRFECVEGNLDLFWSINERTTGKSIAAKNVREERVNAAKLFHARWSFVRDCEQQMSYMVKRWTVEVGKGGVGASMMMMLGFGHRNSLFSVLDCRSLLFCHRTNGLPFNGLGAKLTLALAQVASDIRVSVNHLSSTSSIWAETKSILCRFLLLSFRDIFSLRPFAPRLPRQNGNSPLFTHCQLKFE